MVDAMKLATNMGHPDLGTRPVGDFRFYFAYRGGMFDPDAGVPRPNRTLIYLGACVIAGLRLAREKQVNVRVRPTGEAIEESVDLAHEIFNRVFRKTYRRLGER
jgi:hypothetical protein